MPSLGNTATHVKESMYENKMVDAQQAAVLFAQDNKDIVKNLSAQNIDTIKCTPSGLKYTCNIKLSYLVSEGYLNYDGDNIIVDPRGIEPNLNNKTVQIIFDDQTKKVKKGVKPYE